MCQHECNCPEHENSKEKQEDCTLNQVIKCHGDEPLKEILSWFKNEKE